MGGNEAAPACATSVLPSEKTQEPLLPRFNGFGTGEAFCRGGRLACEENSRHSEGLHLRCCAILVRFGHSLVFFRVSGRNCCMPEFFFPLVYHKAQTGSC